MTPLEKLFGIVDKFNNAMGPGVTPVKTVLGKGVKAIGPIRRAAGAARAVMPGTKLEDRVTGAATLFNPSLGTAIGLGALGADAALKAGYADQIKPTSARGAGYAGMVDANLPVSPKARVPNFGGAEYKQEEQDMINAAQLFRGQQNRAAQKEAGTVYGSLPADYVETQQNPAFQQAAKAGDPQPQFIQSMTSGLDTKTAKREAPPKELSAGMAAWAKANPELANNLIDKVQDRRQKNPDYQQSGYDTIFETMRPELYQ